MIQDLYQPRNKRRFIEKINSGNIIEIAGDPEDRKKFKIFIQHEKEKYLILDCIFKSIHGIHFGKSFQDIGETVIKGTVIDSIKTSGGDLKTKRKTKKRTKRTKRGGGKKKKSKQKKKAKKTIYGKKSKGKGKKSKGKKAGSQFPIIQEYIPNNYKTKSQKKKSRYQETARSNSGV